MVQIMHSVGVRPMAHHEEYIPTGIDRWLTSKQIRAILGIANSTFHAWINEGQFPQGVKMGSRSVRWRESTLNKWLKEQERNSAA